MGIRRTTATATALTLVFAFGFLRTAVGDLISGSAVFKNQSFSPMSATFTLECDAVPGGSAIDAVTGISNGAVSAFSQIAVAARFNSSGKLDVYSSTGYVASTYAYASGVSYHFRFVVNPSSRTYDFYVKSGSGSETKLGSSLSFRSTATASPLGNVTAWADTGFTHQVKNVVVYSGTVRPSPTPSPAPSPSPSPTGGVVPPANSTLIKAWDHAASAAPLAAYNTQWVPSPWIVDFCGPDSVRVSDANTRLHTTLADGKIWDPFYTYTEAINYCRSELSYKGTGAFGTGYTTIVEWKGYFPQAMPAVDPDGRSELTGPFQVHNNGGGSPMFALGIDVAGKNIILVRHGPDNSTVISRTVIAPYSAFQNQSGLIRMYLKPSGSSDGSLKIEVNGVVKVNLTGIVSSSTPGSDYVKFGLYDWGRAVVSPSKASRGRVFDMVTESFRIYRQN